MSDASLDSAYNYGSGSFGRVATSGMGIIQRLQNFRHSADAQNSGLHERVVRAAGEHAFAVEQLRQTSKTDRLKMRLEHPKNILETAAGLNAKSVQASGKGDVAATFGAAPRRTAAKPAAAKAAPAKTTAAKPAAKPAVEMTAAPATRRSRTAAGNVETSTGKAVMAAAESTRGARPKTGEPIGQRSTATTARKTGATAKPAVTAKPAAQRRAVKPA